MRTLTTLVALFTMTTLIAAQTPCELSKGSAPAMAHASGDIVETAIAAGSFKTLVAAVGAAGLVDTLKGKGPFTVFAPTDEAFARLPKGTVEHLLKPENKQELVSILTYHVIAGRVASTDVMKWDGVSTVNGQRLAFKAQGDSVTIDNAGLVKADIACSNGLIHVVDNVLLPESKNLVQVAAAAGSFKTLLAAATAAELAETLSTGGPFTIFAPTDAAFAKLPAGTVESLLLPENKGKLQRILKYHVVSGRVDKATAASAGKAATLEGGTVHLTASDKGLKVKNANIVATDIDASNGIIHVIDTVLLPD